MIYDNPGVSVRKTKFVLGDTKMKIAMTIVLYFCSFVYVSKMYHANFNNQTLFEKL